MGFIDDYSPGSPLKKDIRAAFAEFCATTLFVFCGCCSVVNDPTDTTAIALTFGFAIVVLVQVFGPESGGHINPAVTYFMLITKNIQVRRGLLYIAGQLLGSIIGAALLRASVGTRFSNGLGANDLQEGWAAGEAFLLEIVLSFLLVFTVFHLAIRRKHYPSALNPLVVGYMVVVAHLTSMRLDGTSINPARSFGPAVVQNWWSYHWLFWFGPLTGATLAPIILYAIYGTLQPLPPPRSSQKGGGGGGDDVELARNDEAGNQ
jgi:MIP family channel proteins